MTYLKRLFNPTIISKIFTEGLSAFQLWNEQTIALTSHEIKKKDDKKMPGPGFEPGLLRPQRRVLTTRRSR